MTVMLWEIIEDIQMTSKEIWTTYLGVTSWKVLYFMQGTENTVELICDMSYWELFDNKDFNGVIRRFEKQYEDLILGGRLPIKEDLPTGRDLFLYLEANDICWLKDDLEKTIIVERFQEAHSGE